MAATFQVTFDSKNPAAHAAFWAQALGYITQPPPEGFDSWEDWARAMEIPEENWNDAAALLDPDGVGPRFYFQRVPEDKVAKNRMHLDINRGGGHEVPVEERRKNVDAAVARLLGIGATSLGAVEQRGEYWVVMQDPEGNEFCIQ